MIFGRTLARDRSRGHDRRSLSPLNFAPAFWLRADLGVVAPAAVSEWKDQSGNGRSFAQGSVPDQPIYLPTGGPQGTPCIEVGPDKWLASTGAASLWGFLHRSSVVTFWSVVRTVDVNPAGVNPVAVTAILATASSSALGPGIAFLTEDRNAVIVGGDGIRVVTYTTTVTQYDTRSNSGALPGATWRVTEFNYLPATGVFLVSNGLDAGFQIGPFTPQAADPPGAVIGRLLTLPTAGTRIRIAEMGAFISPSTNTLSQLRAYLTRRYALAAGT